MSVDIDNLPTVGPAKWQRAQRRLGGSASTIPDRPRLIVLHTIESPELSGQAQMTAVWMRDNGTYGTEIVSSHVAADDLGVIRCVDDTAVAFTCGTPWNDCSLNIEMSGRAAQQDTDWRDPYSTALREHVAQLTAAWCGRHDIPAVYLDFTDLLDWRYCTGITTHAQVALASQHPELIGLGYKPGNHTDPGSQFPIDEFIARVTALIHAPTEEDDMQAWQDPRYKNAFYSTTGVALADGEGDTVTIIKNAGPHDPKLAACIRCSWGIIDTNPAAAIARAAAAGFLIPA